MDFDITVTDQVRCYERDLKDRPMGVQADTRPSIEQISSIYPDHRMRLCRLRRDVAQQSRAASTDMTLSMNAAMVRE